jgi:hypothetical protein
MTPPGNQPGAEIYLNPCSRNLHLEKSSKKFVLAKLDLVISVGHIYLNHCSRNLQANYQISSKNVALTKLDLVISVIAAVIYRQNTIFCQM